jgi:iron complex outermembrane receptor protein
MGLSATLLTLITAAAAEDAIIITSKPALQQVPEPLPVVLDHDADLGSALRRLPGIDAVRMGGHALDPVIRGQGGERVSVTVDGAAPHGACPSRMDPASDLLHAHADDDISVQLGVHSMLGATLSAAGTVTKLRAYPVYDRNWATLSANYLSNGDYHAIDTSAGAAWSEQMAISGRAAYHDGNDYDDGNGDNVASQFTSMLGGASVALLDARGGSSRADVDLRRTDDIAYPGAMMDSPESEQITAHAGHSSTVAGFDLDLDLSYDDIDHVMDNYSLRTVINPMGMQSFMRADTTSETLSLAGEARRGAGEFGLYLQRHVSDGRRRMGMGAGGDALPMLQAILWPDVTSDTVAVAYQHNLLSEPSHSLVVGGRLSLNNASADAADAQPTAMGMRSPNDLYRDYYGIDANAADADITIDALIRYQAELNEEMTSWVGLSRVTRHGDVTERFIAADNSNHMMRWIGNPGLDPEAHHQLEAGLRYSDDTIDSALSLFYDRVSDYILRDRVNTMTDNATIYRNIDAELYGGEWSANWQTHAQVALSAQVSYVHGDNRDEDRPLAQIPACGGRLGVTWTGSERLALGIELAWAGRQDRVDDDAMDGSGQDLGATPGYAVVNAHATYQLNEHLTGRLAVDNVFDRAYAHHLNKADLFAASNERVYEPGLGLALSFSAHY